MKTLEYVLFNQTREFYYQEYFDKELFDKSHALAELEIFRQGMWTFSNYVLCYYEFEQKFG